VTYSGNNLISSSKQFGECPPVHPRIYAHVTNQTNELVCRAVRLLCEANADVNVRDLIGRTALWLAVCKDGRLSQVRALLKDPLCETNYADRREKRTALQVSMDK